MPPALRRFRLVLLPLALLLTACSVPPAESITPTPTSAGHGGPAERSSPPFALTTIDPHGVVGQVDLETERRAELGTVSPPQRVHSDGRYVFSEGEAGVTILDSGRWTWDHGDHFHYYLAEPRVIGTVAGDGPVTVATTLSSTTGSTGIFFGASGEAVLLDTAALAEGEIVERFRLERAPHDGLVVPVGPGALVSEPTGGVAASLVLHRLDGRPWPDIAIECPGARGTVTTRVGAVVGCADGAVLATADAGNMTVEKVPYPADATAPPATEFAGRKGRPTIAAPAGEVGVWMLDTREKAWTLLPSAMPLVRVVAVDDEAATVVAVTADGRVRLMDGHTGAVRAETSALLATSLADPDAAAGVTLTVDDERAYVNAPAKRAVYEIDLDDARVTRTFHAADVPAFLAQTGR